MRMKRALKMRMSISGGEDDCEEGRVVLDGAGSWG